MHLNDGENKASIILEADKKYQLFEKMGLNQQGICGKR